MTVTCKDCKRVVTILAAVALCASLCGCPTPSATSTRAYRIDANAALRQAIEHENSFTRAHAIEALAETMGSSNGLLFVESLADKSPLVRFAAAMAIGDVRYAPGKRRLLKMAADKKVEPDKRVFCAVIYALHRLGNDQHAGPLAELLFDTEKGVRANAAMAMGKMGEPSAEGPLKQKYNEEQESSVKLQISESLAMLGNERHIRLLETYTKTQYLEDRLVAIQAMAKLGSPRTRHVAELLLAEMQPPRVRVAAAGALAQLGTFNATGFAYCQNAAKDPRKVLEAYFANRRTVANVEVSSIQQLAARSLGWFKRDGSLSTLQPLLRSKDGSVRVAAAMSILRIVSRADGPRAAAKDDPARRNSTGGTGKMHTAAGKD